jgi:hypothetical protein
MFILIMLLAATLTSQETVRLERYRSAAAHSDRIFAARILRVEAHPLKLPAGYGYGDSDFFQLPVHGGRTLDIRVTALDDALRPSSAKAVPAIGVWMAADADGSPPRLSSSGFNSTAPHSTALTALINSDATLKIGFNDARGEGRPDLAYHARILYLDTVAPARVQDAAAPVTLSGVGLRPDMQVLIGGQPAAILANDATHLIVAPPTGLGSGALDVEVHDAATGADSLATAALTMGAMPSDRIAFATAGNPPMPLGSTLTLRAHVTDSSGTPLAGVPVAFNSSFAASSASRTAARISAPSAAGPSPQSTFSACTANPCSFLTDAEGNAEADLLIRDGAALNVVASLTFGQAALTTVSSTDALALIASLADQTVIAGVSGTLPFTVRFLSAGQPLSARTITFRSLSADVILSAAQAMTAADGSATVTANYRSLTQSVTSCRLR